MGVSSHNTGQMSLYASADSSYAGHEDDRHSFSGAAAMFSGSAVAWFCRTQQVVALFSTEAEFMAMGEFVNDLDDAKYITSSVGLYDGVKNQISGC
ncbi:unnamed protein product, partial [Discosporangium mesarthrocarpum]